MPDHTDDSTLGDFWDRFDQEPSLQLPLQQAPQVVPGILVEIKPFRKRGRHSTGKKGCIIRISPDGSEELLFSARHSTYRHLTKALRRFTIGSSVMIPIGSPLASKGKTFFATTSV